MENNTLQSLLRLPEAVPINALPEKKFVSSDVDISGLKPRQREIFDSFIQLVKSNKFSRSCIKGYAGTGKAQPLTSKVYTPTGYVLMGDLSIGDEILTADGKIQYVEQIHPQGNKEVYEVVFSDGTIVECCEDHLWKTYTYSDRNCNRVSKYKGRNKVKYSVMTTKDIKDSLYNVRGGLNHKMPMPTPVFFEKQYNVIDPYIMGLLLGDGSLTGSNTIISTGDEEIIQEVSKRLPIGFTIEKIPSGKYEYNIKSNGKQGSHFIHKYLTDVNLNVKSEHKYIPESYLYTDYEDRLELIRGLMDSDGTVDYRNGYSSSFCTISNRLCEDFCELVRSVGGVASVSNKNGGEYKDSYIVTVNMPNGVNPFRLKRKKDIYKHKTKYETALFIVDVRATGKEVEQQCITVSGDDSLYLTDGFKITHNTYLTTKIIEMLLSQKNYKVCMTAPTNKAVKVLREKSNFIDVNLRFATIHSLLGLVERQMPNGEIKFVEDKERGNTAGGYDIIVIDETSMLNNELLLGSPYLTGLFEIAEYNDIHILFVGDPKQIPPVGAKESIIFECPERYGVVNWELDEIIRQAKGNPIIDVTMKVRNNMHRPNALLVREDSYLEDVNEGVHFLGIDDKDAFNQLLRTYFTSENFKENPDFSKVIAFTNKTVGLFNRKIRSMLFKIPVNSLDKLYIGEKLLANSPILEVVDKETRILFPTNAEFVVKSFTITTGMYDGAELKYYDTIVQYLDDGDVWIDKRIKIIHEESEPDIDLILDHYSTLAKNAKKGSFEGMNAWAKFWEVKRMFADINYNYAITSHKSQGSTYDNVFAIESDIDIAKDIQLRNRIKYTAFTRPRKNLFIIE